MSDNDTTTDDTTEQQGVNFGAAGDLPAGLGVPDPVSLEEILASAPGVEPGAGIELTDEEFDSFMAAIHGE